MGIGTGRFVSTVVSAGHHLSGADASPDMLGRVPMLDQNVPLLVAEGASLPFTDDSFDLVYGLRFLSQTESREYALTCVGEMLRVSRSGGFCFLEFLSARRPLVRSSPQVRLSPADVEAVVRTNGADLVNAQGRFMVGMTPIRRAPGLLAAGLGRADRVLSRASVDACSRIYLTVRKR